MTTFAEYRKLGHLLALQEPGDDHDEMLFIVIHQTYELWFKEILHEFDYLQRLLAKDDLPRAGHAMKRVLTILKVLVAQVDILETMTPLEFLSFRKRLESGSGFQSAQFRELEFVTGQNPKTAQTFARHCSITLTMDRYSHVAGARSRGPGRPARPDPVEPRDCPQDGHRRRCCLGVLLGAFEWPEGDFSRL